MANDNVTFANSPTFVIGGYKEAVLTGGYVPQSTGVNTDYSKIAAQFLQLTEVKAVATGSKPIVVCGGVVTEVKDMDEAQRLAEEQAHAKSANAYILKPVRMVAPKRDVVTTDL